MDIPHCSLPLSPCTPPFERSLMTLKIPTGPDEETPLLGGKAVSDIGRTSGPDRRDATLEEPPSLGSRTQSSNGNAADFGGVAEAVKKTPLPWAQLSIVLLSQLAEPLNSQVIYPVSALIAESLAERLATLVS